MNFFDVLFIPGLYYLDPLQDDYQRKTTLPLYTDDFDSVQNLTTGITTNGNLTLDLPSTNSSSTTTPIPSPESHKVIQNERRRSISPPLPPQMSPDNGRPLHHLTQITTQRITNEENIESLERSKSNSRTQV